MTEIYCEDCDLDFDGKMWEDGACPNCHRTYTWDEVYCEESNDIWIIVEWC